MSIQLVNVAVLAGLAVFQASIASAKVSPAQNTRVIRLPSAHVLSAVMVTAVDIPAIRQDRYASNGPGVHRPGVKYCATGVGSPISMSHPPTLKCIQSRPLHRRFS